MPVMVLRVDRPLWNRVELAAVTFGLDMEPTSPECDGFTMVEISGSLEKLQQTLCRIGPGPVLNRVVDRLPLFDPETERGPQ